MVKALTDLGRAKDVKKELQNLVVIEKHNTWRWRELISIRSNRKSLFITTATCILQECCGMLAVLFFSTTIFQIASSSIAARTATIILGATQFVTILIAPTFVEKAGRRVLLLISTGGCFLCMASLGLYFYLDFLKNSSVFYIRWLPLVATVLSYSSFSFGLNIIPNALLGEMYRPNVRSIGSSISMTVGWIAGIISITSFGYIVEAIGSFVMFFIYSAINVVGFIFILKFVPETKGLSLKEIEMMLS